VILVGNQRGNYVDAARHFMNGEDNEKVIVHEIRGFIGNDLHSAFQESYACSLGTKCKQHLYSLSLSPPKDANVSAEEFEEAIDRAEKRLGLTGQPRAVIFHQKRGRDDELRTHAHAVWCRVDAENGKAIQMSYDHSILFDYSRELFLENGWELPKGYENKAERCPLNYTHAQYQQAKRRGKYADDIKRVFQDAWAQSDTAATFANALKENGYVLARGDGAAFVAVDSQAQVYSVARSITATTKEIRERFGEMDDLPSVQTAELQARDLSPALSESFNTEPKQSLPEPQIQPDNSPIARRIRQNPEHILSIITDKESVFTRHKIAKGLNAYIHDPQEYRNAYERVLASRQLVALNADASTPDKNIRYSTREIVELEAKLMRDARLMSDNPSFNIPVRNIRKAIKTTASTLYADAGAQLSTEQKAAIRHITNSEQLSCVVGVAGAGKSTILAAARQAWEESGHRVFGAALAGKAAKGLEQSSGVQSRTLASFELSWQNEVNQLQRGDVLVIDEAGMIGSKQMARFISEAKDKGAKLVLVGDAEQLQPINAGAPFRAITENIQPATLHEVHRQKQEWQKQASQDFASGRTQTGLNAYLDHNSVDVTETKDDAIAAIASDYLNDFWSCDGRVSQIALAHRKVDVKAINQTIREMRKEAGELEDSAIYKTAHGKREFASGDRLLFTRNDRDTGVKNGMLGTVLKTDKHHLSIVLDDRENGAAVMRTISLRDYADIEHGYATTIHKAQGATVDKSYVLASRTMDRHLTYVAMTRHRQETKLYTDREEFQTFGRLCNSLSRKRQKQSTFDFSGTVKDAKGIQRHKERQRYLEKMSGTGTSFQRSYDPELEGPELEL